jgi:H+/gluconate symporter-like permease
VAHGYLPPHPAPTYVSFIYEANVNKVLLYGLVPVIPACLLGGILLSKCFRNLHIQPPAGLFQERQFKREELPGLAISVFTASIPVLLMLLGAIVDLAFGPPPARADLVKHGFETLGAYYQHYFSSHHFSSPEWIARGVAAIKFLSDANVALFMAVAAGCYTLGLRRGKSMEELMKTLSQSVGAISMIILIIAGGGAFSQVLKDCHVNDYIARHATSIHVNPLLLAFMVAALFRLAVGSATVATMTTAPIMLPIAQQTGTCPELMVIATGAGSIMWSHFNDIGFWMFKEYFNLSIKQTFLSWTVMECIVGIVGIVTVLIMNCFM